MVRNILFKAKSLDERKWVEGYLYIRNDGVYEINYYNKELKCERYTHEVDAKTTCQYTGLTAYWYDFENEPQECDVWERDLLEVNHNGRKVIAEVKYDGGMFILTSNEFADFYIPLFDVVQVEDDYWVDAKVVGNVFDNPELLH